MFWAPAQTSRAPDRRQRLQPSQLPQAPQGPLHPAHDPRAARPTRAKGQTPGTTAELGRRDLRAAQRGGAVCKQTQTVAWDRYSVREAGRELSGGGCNRCADDLVDCVNRQTDPSARGNPEASPSWMPARCRPTTTPRHRSSTSKSCLTAKGSPDRELHSRGRRPFCRMVCGVLSCYRIFAGVERRDQWRLQT